MGHVSSHDHDGLGQDVRNVAAVKSLVGSPQLAVDLQKKVVESGGLDVGNVLLLDHLGGDLLQDIALVLQTVVDQGIFPPRDDEDHGIGLGGFLQNATKSSELLKDLVKISRISTEPTLEWKLHVVADDVCFFVKTINKLFNSSGMSVG